MTAAPPPPFATDVSPRVRGWWSALRCMVPVLTVVLIGLLLLTDPAGYLSTDVGGKMATMEAMDRRGDFSPDLGYWAADLDPDGSLYPMWSTLHAGDAWVNATSLPMLYLARPLYALGGPLAAGLLPVLGTVAAALAARSLSRRLGGDGVWAFWVVGLATPATVYALSFWEHAPALALMLWAVTLSLDASRPDGSWRPALAAGLLFGLAATMRQEALLYGFTTGVAVGVRLLAGRRPLTAVLRGAAMVPGLVAMLIANDALEVWAIGASSRSGRMTGTAAAVGGDPLLRLEEAIVTGASPFAQVTVVNLLLALSLVGALIMVGRTADDGVGLDPYRAAALAVFGLWALDLVIDGWGFTPGLAATTPIAVMAIPRLRRDADHLFVGAIALATMPLVWAFGFTGGAGPQWGGRYLLPSGALLVTLAMTAFVTPAARDLLRKVALVSMVITFAGVGFAMVRTHGNADAMRTIAAFDEDAVVFHSSHRAREGGPLVLDERWLAASEPETRAEAGELLLEAGFGRVAFVGGWTDGEPPNLPGWRVVDTGYVPLVGQLVLAVAVFEPA